MKAIDRYITVQTRSEAQVTIQNSKFLAVLCPVGDEREISELLEKMRQAHPKANHVCYAWRLGAAGQYERSSDDGEPSGTAGKPILHRLQLHDLTNALLMVVRYFGGVKLGTGGLIKAYRDAASEVIAVAQPVEQLLTESVWVAGNLEVCGQILALPRLLGCQQGRIAFTDASVEVELLVPPSEKSELLKQLLNYPEAHVLTNEE